MQNIKDSLFLKQLGKRIKEERKKKKLSQLDIAVMMDNHAEHISRIERGKLNISVCTLKKIAEAIDIPMQDLLP